MMYIDYLCVTSMECLICVCMRALACVCVCMCLCACMCTCVRGVRACAACGVRASVHVGCSGYLCACMRTCGQLLVCGISLNCPNIIINKFSTCALYSTYLRLTDRTTWACAHRRVFMTSRYYDASQTDTCTIGIKNKHTKNVKVYYTKSNHINAWSCPVDSQAQPLTSLCTS